MQELKPSPASAIRPITKVIELPDAGPDGPIRIEIRKHHPAELLTALGALTSMPVGEPAKGLEAVAVAIAKSKVPFADVAQAVIVAPEFSFGDAPEEGKAWWGHLSWANQMAVFNESLAFAGLSAEIKEGSDAAVARRVARFPRHKEGKKVRTRARANRAAQG